MWNLSFLATGIPRPHQTVKTRKNVSERLTAQAQVWDAQPRRHKLPQGQIHRFFSMRSTPTGTPKPHQWLLMGVQACHLPAPKPLKPLKRLKRLKRLKPLKLCQSVWDAQPPGVRSQQAPQGHINGFLWVSKPAVCQPLNA